MNKVVPSTRRRDLKEIYEGIGSLLVATAAFPYVLLLQCALA